MNRHAGGAADDLEAVLSKALRRLDLLKMGASPLLLGDPAPPVDRRPASAHRRAMQVVRRLPDAVIEPELSREG